ncbi:SHOCT domain-containing protein [Oerskovia sp. NPDC060338]|uniref:SHOCT domain-containing protein n=1 Tax=Oerskovia sp. NPDC060338 TaxID=3347100 RepID=UPI003658D588
MTFWQSALLVVEIFFFMAYLVILFHVLSDLFRDRGLGGVAKAAWILFLVLVPVLTALVYVIARGRGMAQRQNAAVDAARQRTDDYIRQVAATSPAQDVAAAKALLDSGAISSDEFDRLKAVALAAA